MDLVVIGGMPRSGTTLTGALLASSPDVEVYNEIAPLDRFPALVDLTDQVRSWSEAVIENPHEAWRQLSEPLVHDRVLRLFREFCRATGPHIPEGSDRWDAPVAKDARLMAVKQPNSELQVPELDRILGPKGPRLVYCMRDPGGIYESFLSVPWGASVTPAEFVERLRTSVAAASALGEERVVVFDVDRATEDREATIERFFGRLDVPVTDPVRRFASVWRPVNRSAGRFDEDALVVGEEREERLAAFRDLFAADSELRQDWERLRASA
jgi:hypothetical protein